MLIEIAPRIPVLAYYQSGVNRSAQHFGRTVPFFFGDFLANLVEEGIDRCQGVARTRAQAQLGVGRLLGVPVQGLDDLGASVAGFGTEVDEARSKHNLGGIAWREQHKFGPFGFSPAYVGQAVPEQITHLARAEFIADAVEVVGHRLVVSEQFCVVERLGYRQRGADAAAAVGEEDAVPWTRGATVAAGGPLEAAQDVDEQLIDEEHGPHIDVKPSAGRFPTSSRCAAARGDEVVGVDISVEEIDGRGGDRAVEKAAALLGTDADVVADGPDFDFGEGGVGVLFFGDDAQILDDLVAIFKRQVEVHAGIDRDNCVLRGVLQGDCDFGGRVGLGGAIDRIEFEYVLRSLDPCASGGIDRKLAQRASTLAVGKAQHDLASQHGSA